MAALSKKCQSNCLASKALTVPFPAPYWSVNGDDGRNLHEISGARLKIGRNYTLWNGISNGSNKKFTPAHRIGGRCEIFILFFSELYF